MRVLDKTEWPYCINVKWKDIKTSHEMQKWCNENIGKEHAGWYRTNFTNLVSGNWDQRWHFTNEADKLMFMLRWE